MDIVLLHPEIPHNTGAIGRLCVGLGWPLHLVRPIGFSLDENHVRRAGMDYWKHLDLTLHDSFEDYLALRKPSHLCFLSTKGTRTLYEAPLFPDGALVFGCESSGLPKEYYTRYVDQLAILPMPGPYGRSINLANAVAIAAYEAFRRFGA
ncbi:MAG: tRNA (cytidine(34)-2'-O)-methyltransferase [Kiritimatiellia bacterium]